MVKSKKPTRKYRRLSDPSATFAKRTVLIVIVILTVAIIATLTSALFFDNEKNIKGRIDEMAKDYYENYFYEQLINSKQYKQADKFNEIMEKYHVGALNPLSLRDLLVYDNKKNSQYEDYLTKYCDKDSTTVRIFPDPPYDRTSYHTEISYSCNF